MNGSRKRFCAYDTQSYYFISTLTPRSKRSPHRPKHMSHVDQKHKEKHLIISCSPHLHTNCKSKLIDPSMPAFPCLLKQGLSILKACLTQLLMQNIPGAASGAGGLRIRPCTLQVARCWKGLVGLFLSGQIFCVLVADYDHTVPLPVFFLLYGFYVGARRA